MTQGGVRPRWSKIFPALHKAVMPRWTREAAWSILHGTIQWGAERMSFSPETSVCRCCSSLDAPTVLETPEHFALCPAFDALWFAATRSLDLMSLPVPVRKWFVLYGPETMTVRPGRYSVVLWVWAALVATMLLVRRTHSVDKTPLSKHSAVAIFTAQLRTISRMDLIHENDHEKWSHKWHGFARVDPSTGVLSYGQ